MIEVFLDIIKIHFSITLIILHCKWSRKLKIILIQVNLIIKSNYDKSHFENVLIKNLIVKIN